MGMSASQGKLLFMTARISNNEFQQQSIAFAKERLANRSEAANDKYLEALNATKFQFVASYNGVNVNYEDLTYNQLFAYNSASSAKQFVVKNNKGKVLVPNEIARAFQKYNGDFNRFLKDLGYTQSKVNKSTNSEESEEEIHNAWDKYLVSVGQSINDIGNLHEHILGFGFKELEPAGQLYNGYPTFLTARATIKGTDKEINLYQNKEGYYLENNIISYETYKDEDGDTQFKFYYQTPEQLSTGERTYLNDPELGYDISSQQFTYGAAGNILGPTIYYNPRSNSISDKDKEVLSKVPGSENEYTSPNSGVNYIVALYTNAINFEGTTQAQRELYDYAMAVTANVYQDNDGLQYDAGLVNYYKNLFNEMSSCGYATLDGKVHEHDSEVSEADFRDTNWFVNQLKSGALTISFFSNADRAFKATSMSEEGSIVEKEDKAKIAIAEQEYNAMMDKIEREDKKFDMQLNKLETEHQALVTEIDALNKVIQNNVKSSFGTFKTSV